MKISCNNIYNIYDNIYINHPGGYAIFETVEECDLFIEYIHSLKKDDTGEEDTSDDDENLVNNNVTA